MVKYFVLSQYEPILLLRENEIYYVGNEYSELKVRLML